jgi:hypothetical protein
VRGEGDHEQQTVRDKQKKEKVAVAYNTEDASATHAAD